MPGKTAIISSEDLAAAYMDTGLGSLKMVEFDDIDELQIEIQQCGHHWHFNKLQTNLPNLRLKR
jgi:hypothetical protein